MAALTNLDDSPTGHPTGHPTDHPTDHPADHPADRPAPDRGVAHGDNQQLGDHVSLSSSIERACQRIAPTWPLDQLIAVNPYWGWRELPIQEAAGRLAVLGGTPLTMTRPWFGQECQAGRLTTVDVVAAARSLGVPTLATPAHDVLRQDAAEDPAPPRLALVTDLRDAAGPPRPGQRWGEHVIHQISQHCAAHADRWQASWRPSHDDTLYHSWLDQPSLVHGVRWRHGRNWVRQQLRSLPETPSDAIAAMLRALDVEPEGHEAYLTALLLSVNGWASWYAYARWQARLHGADDDAIVELLAIRLAWEWLLRGDAQSEGGSSAAAEHAAWAASWANADARAKAQAHQHEVDWVLQTAAEHAYQRRLIESLRHRADSADSATSGGRTAPDTPAVQAVFCIDVRSEVLRRALEAAAPEVSTRGFAGFFGLPISFRPTGTDIERPQLPALLAPSLEVSDDVDDEAVRDRIAARRRGKVGRLRRAATVRHAPSSMFTFVEAAGLLYGPKLIKESLSPRRPAPPVERYGVTAALQGSLRPRLRLVGDDPEAAATLAARILGAMGLVDNFAPLVLLCGHGAETANNPHAAGLHCGACGGQRGDINARALADLLNTPSVRASLTHRGIDIPSGTWFVAALHTTTTDDVTLFDTDLVPEALRPALGELQRWLEEAGRRTRAERAERLGVDTAAAERAVRRRAGDWSQVRPEWGLAGNAAFVMAPRSRTRGLDLAGRVFLHDYDWRLDPQLEVLTLLMTAPMVVTNWINLQYYASTVDNRRYGSGNKALHNVVGGRIGVFEGNGGDLRTGLALQSLHDGEHLQHPPLRLSVFIEAPQAAIDEVIASQPVVASLVSNGWLHLLRLEESDGDGLHIERWTAGGWAQP